MYISMVHTTTITAEKQYCWNHFQNNFELISHKNLNQLIRIHLKGIVTQKRKLSFTVLTQ